MKILNKIGCVAFYIAMLFGVESMVFQAWDAESKFQERINQDRAAKAKLTDDELVNELITYKYAPELMESLNGKDAK